MATEAKSPAPRARRARDLAPRVWIAIALCAAALLAVMAHGTWHRRHRVVRIATGPRGGTFLPLGSVLARTLTSRIEGVSAQAVESAGGAGNLRLLERGEVELALVANDDAGGSFARGIAPVYQEVFQIVVRGEITGDGVEALRGRRVVIGPEGSGSDAIGRRVFSHFGPLDRVDVRNLPHLEAAEAFVRGDVDAVCVLAGLRALVVERMLSVPGAHLLSLGDPADRGSALEGVRIDAPFLSVAVIPARTYRDEPHAAVGTFGVSALLVARSDLPDDLVADITRTLFEQKVRLAAEDRLFAHLSERFDPSELQYPLHAGAVRYYRRNDPPFIVAWADTLSLGLTAFVMTASGLAALRTARRRRRKHRVERFYSEIQSASLARDHAPDLDALVAAKERLHGIRRRAFEELMSERLEADESFTIFQDYVRSELLEIDAAIRERRSSIAPLAETETVKEAS